MELEPLAGTGNKVFVLPAKKADKITAGGIIIASAQQEEPKYGVVLSVSEQDSKGIKPTVKRGDTVYFGPNAGSFRDFEGVDFMVFTEAELFGRIPKK